MKSMMKNAFSAVIMFAVCAILVLAFPQDANAVQEGNYAYTVTDGKATITDLINKRVTSVTVPSTLGGFPVTAIGDYAFSDNDNFKYLRSVVIPEGITSIGSGAFSDCVAIESVTIPASVTEIGNGAFYDCRGLKGVYISDLEKWINVTFKNDVSNPMFYAGNLYLNGELVTDVVIPEYMTTIPNNAFNGWRCLKNITLHEKITKIGEDAFSECSGLTSITIPAGVTEIGGYAFYGCSGLKGVYITDIEKWCRIIFASTQVYSENYYANPLCYATKLYLNNELVTDLVIPETVTYISDYAFFKCSSLTSVTIPDSITEIGMSAFHNCKNLSDVYISDLTKWCEITFKNSAANPLAYAKRLRVNNQLVTELVIPDGVTAIADYVFNGYIGLTKVTVPMGVSVIGEDAFRNCTNLKSINIPGSITVIKEKAFDECEALEYVNIEDLIKWCSITFDGDSANPLYYGNRLYLNGQLITDLVIPDEVTAVSDYAFRGCTSIKSLTIHEGVTDIGESAFSGCSGLVDLYISDLVKWCGFNFKDSFGNPIRNADNFYLNGQLVTELIIPDGVTAIADYVFSGYIGLTKVTIPGSVSRIGKNAFSGCENLTDIIISEGVESIGEHAFSACDGLTSITIPESVTAIDAAFRGCTSLTGVYITDMGKWCSIHFGNNSHTNPLYYAKRLYLNNELVTNVVIPQGVTIISDYAFDGYSELISVTIPDSVTSIGKYAFQGCDNLTGIVLPDSVTNIGVELFGGCTNLTSVKLSKGLKTVPHNAFYGCSKLTDVFLPEGLTTIGGYAFYGCSSLTELKIPDSVTSIGYHAFHNCISLKSVIIPHGVTTINLDTFNGCTSLESVVIPNSVTEICVRAFENCSALPKLVIPDSVTMIDFAFYKCDSLTFYMQAKSKSSDWSYGWNNQRPVVWGYGAVELVSLDKETGKLETIGETLQLTATVSPEEAIDKSVTWVSSNPSVATVDDKGFVTAVGNGEATITVTSADDGRYTAKCVITVEVSASDISIDKTEASMASVGETLQLTATVYPEETIDKSVIWTSSNTEVATVDENGIVTAVGYGEATIAATTVDGSFIANCDITVGGILESADESSTKENKISSEKMVLCIVAATIIVVVLCAVVIIIKKRK